MNKRDDLIWGRILAEGGSGLEADVAAAWEAVSMPCADGGEDMPSEELAQALQVLREAWACWRETLLP